MYFQSWGRFGCMGRFNVMVFHVPPLASKHGWNMKCRNHGISPSIHLLILRLIRLISTHLESALKGNVKRSNESATAFLVQYIWSRTPNIHCIEPLSLCTTYRKLDFIINLNNPKCNTWYVDVDFCGLIAKTTITEILATIPIRNWQI